MAVATSISVFVRRWWLRNTRAFNENRLDTISGNSFGTTIQVAGLADKDLLIETEAIAALPA